MQERSMIRRRVVVASAATTLVLLAVGVATTTTTTTHAFVPQLQQQQQQPSRAAAAFHHHHHHWAATTTRPNHNLALHADKSNSNEKESSSTTPSNNNNRMAQMLLAGILTASLTFGSPTAVLAENELSAKYGGGLDTSLVDQTCLVDKCSLQAKACLADDPSCRKGLTCTAKCLGDNACITGCMARYGNENLDSLLKCTIEDHECIKVAILPGGADEFGQEPRSPAPTIPNFNVQSMQGNWYKVVGYNPNYDCYACQRNSFASSATGSNQELQMNVEFSMPHLLPDGSPPPPSGARETLVSSAAPTNMMTGSQSIGLNDYSTHETMVFDKATSQQQQQQHPLVLNPGTPQQVSYARTAHSEGEMFGLKFWENWYIIGENDATSNEEFKFIYYNGKTRQNTYNGAFVYSRTKDLGPESLKKVYQIAQQAGMDPKQFCRIQNGCFTDDKAGAPTTSSPLFVDETTPSLPKSGNGNGNSISPFAPNIPFRGILASTKVSELLGVEPVAARDYYDSALLPQAAAAAATPMPLSSSSSSSSLQQQQQQPSQRAWWYEVGDYLENPHRHFAVMDKLRITMDWPEDVDN